MKKLLAVTLMSALMFGAIAANADDDLTPKEQIIKQILQKKYNYDATGILKDLVQSEPLKADETRANANGALSFNGYKERLAVQKLVYARH